MTKFGSLRDFLILDEQVHELRLLLQATSEQDPEFEERLLLLMELVERRNQTLS